MFFHAINVCNDGDIPLALFEKCLSFIVDTQAITVQNTSIASNILEKAYPIDPMVGLVANNNMKPTMMQFVSNNVEFFSQVKLITTGRQLASTKLGVKQLVASGPLG